MPHSFSELSLIYVSFSVLALYAPAVLCALGLAFFLYRRHTRLERRQQKHQRIRYAITEKGLDKRKRMALATQRRNIRELAKLVHGQLKQHERALTPYQNQRTSAFIERAVTTVDFDRLYALHNLLAANDAAQVSPAVETFFEHTR
ncbi:hypothetical protein [Desulfovibrio sp. TomC]|uniref:hypothetical protein n=1 Tax=Desulfovibrio sp. TomC TaxID=1562888 RepID=UPI0005749794|nr:hypothetical protein [Desulfovibrio sp. TomC]KHK00584.1 hypothetical protein NY78_3954 [Desulfovibrio sp. TomC]